MSNHPRHRRQTVQYLLVGTCTVRRCVPNIRFGPAGEGDFLAPKTSRTKIMHEEKGAQKTVVQHDFYSEQRLFPTDCSQRD